MYRIVNRIDKQFSCLSFPVYTDCIRFSWNKNLWLVQNDLFLKIWKQHVLYNKNSQLWTDLKSIYEMFLLQAIAEPWRLKCLTKMNSSGQHDNYSAQCESIGLIHALSHTRWYICSYVYNGNACFFKIPISSNVELLLLWIAFLKQQSTKFD